EAGQIHCAAFGRGDDGRPARLAGPDPEGSMAVAHAETGGRPKPPAGNSQSAYRAAISSVRVSRRRASVSQIRSARAGSRATNWWLRSRKYALVTIGGSTRSILANSG